jgi:hypothetical protein
VLNTSAGTFLTPLVDHVNGIYSRVLQYDVTKDRPVITGSVQGKPLPSEKLFKSWELVLPYAGATFFDNALGLDDGFVLGARLGYRVTNQFTIQGEGGVTFADNQSGQSGRVIQLLANLRYDVKPLQVGGWSPFVTAGVGAAFLRGFGTNDSAFAWQAGVGATYQVKATFGLRGEARLLGLGSVLQAGSTTNYQVTAGLVWWF